MLKTFRSSEILVCALVALGCTPMSPPVDAPTADVPSGTDAGGGGIAISGTVLEFPGNDAIAGASVCVEETTRCVTTDATGAFVLADFPADTESYVHVSMMGFVDGVVALRATAAATLSVGLLRNSTATAFGALASTTFDPMLAHASIGGGGGAAGSTVTDDAATGVGPVYLSAMGAPDPMLTALSTNGTAGWLNLAAGGELEVTLVPVTGATCTRGPLAWPGSTPLSVRIPLVAGALATTSGFICTGPPLFTGDPFDAYVAGLGDDAMTWCTCLSSMLGFASVADCVTGYTPNAAITACNQMAYDAVQAMVETHFTCLANDAIRLGTCLEGATCDPAAYGTCGIPAIYFGANCGGMLAAATLMAYDAVRNPCLDSTVVGPTSTCPEAGPVSMATGPAVFSGTTLMAGDDFDGAAMCGSTGSPDRAYAWMAPAAGMYRFDTLGSTYDTVLYLRNTCADTTDLACSDDTPPATTGGPLNLRSTVTVTLTAGQSVVVVVDGYGSVSAGDFVVNITAL